MNEADNEFLLKDEKGEEILNKAHIQCKDRGITGKGIVNNNGDV